MDRAIEREACGARFKWKANPLYQAEVASVCLHCPFNECVAPDYGCAAYKRAYGDERRKRQRTSGR